MEALWPYVLEFQEQGLATTATIEPTPRERQLVHEFVQKVPLESLFELLQHASDTNDAAKVKTLCNCIDRVLSADGNGGDFYQQQTVPLIVAGLKHSEKQACVLTLRQLEAHLKRNPTIEQAAALANDQVLEVLCSTVADEDIGIASKASLVVQMFCRIPDAAFYRPILLALRTIVSESDVQGDSVALTRYLELLARICEISDDHTAFAIEHHCADLIMECLKSPDVLFVMNILDIIPHLTATRTGLQYVFGSGALSELMRLGEDPIIGGNAVRLVGELSMAAAKLNVKSWNWDDPALCKAFFSMVESKLSSNDQVHQIAAMDAIGAFGASSEKELDVLLKHKSLCKDWLGHGSSTKMPLKVNCLHSLTTILKAPTHLARAHEQIPMGNALVWRMNNDLFEQLGTLARQKTRVAYLMECLKQPFEELRVAVYSLMQAVAAQNNSWGIQALRSYAGLFEFLMDRGTEPNKQTREWKFAVVDAIVASPFLDQLDDIMIGKLTEYLRQGPYIGNPPPSMELEVA